MSRHRRVDQDNHPNDNNDYIEPATTAYCRLPTVLRRQPWVVVDAVWKKKKHYVLLVVILFTILTSSSGFQKYSSSFRTYNIEWRTRSDTTIPSEVSSLWRNKLHFIINEINRLLARNLLL